ncbi:MAG TPA: sugar phosphate nucleotidyltransferase [Candidatus Eisenbacteria bacterium]|nr:sugar phosphate nucleotidyltransferase [Candidatus Eisenbacteria bacterium]
MPDKINTAVIAAAGQATRMWPASKAFPKELFPLGRIPVIVHLLWELRDAGIEQFVVVTAESSGPAVRALLDPSVAPPDKVANEPLVRRFQEMLTRDSVTIMRQTGNYGNGTPLRIAASKIKDQPCIYAFGDDIVVGENATSGLIQTFERTGHPVLAAQEVPTSRKSAFGILECTRTNGIQYISRILEKPLPDETSSNLASFGRYLVTPRLLETLCNTPPGRDGELWFTDSIKAYLDHGGRACAFSLTNGRWYTVGDPRSYAEAVKAATEEQSR